MDLTTQEGVIAYMQSATSTADWNSKCDEVKKANGNNYPPFWFKAIVLSGLMERTLGKENASVKIEAL
jgi:hypothetical protein